MRGVGGGCASQAGLYMGVIAEGPDKTASALDNGQVDAHTRARRYATGAGTLRPGTREFLAAILHQHGLGTHGRKTPAQGAAKREGWPVHAGCDHQTRLRNEDGSSGLRQMNSSRMFF